MTRKRGLRRDRPEKMTNRTHLQILKTMQSHLAIHVIMRANNEYAKDTEQHSFQRFHQAAAP